MSVTTNSQLTLHVLITTNITYLAEMTHIYDYSYEYQTQMLSDTNVTILYTVKSFLQVIEDLKDVISIACKIAESLKHRESSILT